MAEIELRSCVCDRPIHTYTEIPAITWRLVAKSCCRCPEDCLCHMPWGGSGNVG